MNSVNLIGNLGKDPETKYFESGTVKVTFSIAVKGFKKEDTYWIDIEAWGKTAELIAERFTKGSRIGIMGRLTTSQYEKDGQKRTKTFVTVDSIDFLDKKKEEQ